MHRQSINFTDPNASWIKAEVESKEYNSASDFINDLIRRYRREDHSQISVVRALVLEGVKSGITNLTPQKIKEQVKQSKRSSGHL
jgi:putative addiction module CopG family antidote